MNDKTWKPSNKPKRYDKARVATLAPIQQAIERLSLPPLRLRKLNAICGALEMQIEDGGDSPEVNDRLLEALRTAVIHQAGRRRAQAALQTIDDFAQAEKARWEQVRAGTLPPPKLEPVEELNELMQTGYELLSDRQVKAACDQWLRAWELVKRLATPEMRRVKDFDNAYPGGLQSVFNWSQDVEMELHNAGTDDPIYAEHRLRYAREYLAQFPDDGVDRHINFRRAEGEALWMLDRIEESEAVYQKLVAAYPDKAWGYIGWSDQYYLWRNAPGDYERAEKILRRALARPELDDPGSVRDRLAGLQEQRKKAKQAAKRQAKKRKRRFRFGRRKRRKK